MHQYTTRYSFRLCLFNLAILFALSPLGSVAIAQTATGNALGSSFDTQQAVAALPVPSGLTVRQDDRVATLQWNNDPAKVPFERPQNVAGYRVTWGPTIQPNTNVRLSAHNIVQLQPLTNGEPYIATVQSVDSYGNLSAASAPIRFTGDPSRVNALRSRMNGFFDDFNLAQGAVDELKWNTAYSLCNAARGNAYFINNQSHVHNSIFTENCDRGQQVNRARTPLDLGDNGTRTIVFDFDGVHRRNHWYIDLVPAMIDIAGPEKYKPGTLRFTQDSQNVKISTFDASGSEVIVAETNWQPYPTLDYAGVMLVPNVRRSWEIQLRKDSAQIRIDGKLVLATNPGSLELKDDRFHVLWSTFSYNTPKANQPFVLTHWDNFGFDAPAGKTASTVTHNYKLVNSGSDNINLARWNNTSTATVKLNIPDSIQGALGRRLMFTLQMRGNNAYIWSPTDQVLVNDQVLFIPQPVPDTTPPRTDLVSSLSPYTMQLPVPEGVLRQGENTLVFSAESSGILNIHIELDFPAASAPTYTPPSQAADGSALPILPAVGPNLVVSQIGSTSVDPYGAPIWEPGNFNPKVGGLVPITVQAKNDTALEATGTNSGVILLELLVDQRVVMSQRTNMESPAPTVNHTFTLDTRLFANGLHQIYVRAYDPRCTPSIVDYNGAGAEPGHYVPLHITIQNQNTQLVAAAPAPAAGNYTVHVPMAGITNVAACANLALSSRNAAASALPGNANAVQEHVLRREDEGAVPSPREQFFICD